MINDIFNLLPVNKNSLLMANGERSQHSEKNGQANIFQSSIMYVLVVSTKQQEWNRKEPEYWSLPEYIDGFGRWWVTWSVNIDIRKIFLIYINCIVLLDAMFHCLASDYLRIITGNEINVTYIVWIAVNNTCFSYQPGPLQYSSFN